MHIPTSRNLTRPQPNRLHHNHRRFPITLQQPPQEVLHILIVLGEELVVDGVFENDEVGLVGGDVERVAVGEVVGAGCCESWRI